MMKMSADRYQKKGFTLLELMIVIAIIGVLLAVLIPTMSGYFKRSRLSAANSNAKVVFNSLQTICQELEFKERGKTESLFYGENTQSGTIILMSNGGTFIEPVIEIASGIVLQNPADAEALNGTSTEDANAVRQKMVRLFDAQNETVWAAYIENYMVKFVYCADNGTTNYIGGYPIKQEEVAAVNRLLSMTISDFTSVVDEAWGSGTPAPTT